MGLDSIFYGTRLAYQLHLMKKFYFLFILLSFTQASRGHSGLNITSTDANCVQVLNAAGKIKDFQLIVNSKFSRQQLEENRDQLTAKNPNYIIGETGAATWYVENRLVKGFDKPQIVAVKYFKYFGHEEVEQTVRMLNRLHKLFQKLNLLQYFDVLIPLDAGKDHIVAPFIEGVALKNLTLDRLKIFNPPKLFENPNIIGLGPPTIKQDPVLAQLWAAQQDAMRQVMAGLRQAGFKIAEQSLSKSWSGIRYIDYYYVVEKGGVAGNFSMRDDVIVTTDGRFVILDPY